MVRSGGFSRLSCRSDPVFGLSVVYTRKTLQACGGQAAIPGACLSVCQIMVLNHGHCRTNIRTRKLYRLKCFGANKEKRQHHSLLSARFSLKRRMGTVRVATFFLCCKTVHGWDLIHSRKRSPVCRPGSPNSTVPPARR